MILIIGVSDGSGILVMTDESGEGDALVITGASDGGCFLVMTGVGNGRGRWMPCYLLW